MGLEVRAILEGASHALGKGRHVALPLIIFEDLSLVLGDHGLDHDVLHLARFDADWAASASLGELPTIDTELDPQHQHNDGRTQRLRDHAVFLELLRDPLQGLLDVDIVKGHVTA